MSLRTITDIKLPLGTPESKLFELAQKKLGRKPRYFRIVKKSLDARNKNDVRFVYTIAFSAEAYEEQGQVLESLPKEKQPQNPVVVVGSGPAGLFCALRLLARGITPIVVERGQAVEDREKSIQQFIRVGALNDNTNVQFGEGGAGTFSDGKLNTQTHNELQKDVFKAFVEYGAPEEILWLNKPHIGSDNLKKVVKNMRQEILRRGGQVCFETRLDDISLENGRVKEIKLTDIKTGEKKTLSPSALVLCIGHSARDTFEMLHNRGVAMSQKNFAVGVRIEHLQEKIGLAQYGKAFAKLPPADYKLVSHAGERAAFTFCMCPGGIVMPSSSELYGVVTNGMSNYARNEKNANAALIVQVNKEDFAGDSPLAGIAYQRAIERKAFLAGGENYKAPVQLVGDFLKDKESSRFGEVLPSYPIGTQFAPLNAVLPNPIVQTLKLALVDMDRKLHGFAASDAVLTGAETRTSSPVRIDRDESFQSVNTKGLFPCGEGAGYAGGITSSAVDGIRTADAVFACLSR